MVNSNICEICLETFTSEKSLHLHIVKKEKIDLESYYQEFFPRFDWYSNEPINFKSKNQYFNSFFNSKTNLVKWFRESDSFYSKRIVSEAILSNRVKDKGIKKAFTQSELRTIDSPSITTLNSLFSFIGGYNFLIEKLQLKSKFDYQLRFDEPEIKSDLNILIDTREQDPFKFECNSKLKQLQCGDYTADEPYYNDVYVERKSSEDFFGTFGNAKNVERFKKELDRSAKFGFYLFVVVEKSLNFLTNYQHHWAQNSAATIAFSFKNMRDFCQNFDNVQFIFAEDKMSAKNITQKILSHQNPSQYDWQYLIDSKIIC